jgi:hypothetical protein
MSGLVPNTGTNANLNLDGIYLNRGELLHLILSPATDPVGDLTGVELEVRLTEPDPNSEPGILQSPQNVAVLAGQNAAFSTQVDGTPEPGFQWQRSSNNGATWEALVEGAEFTGVNSTNLQLYAVALELNGQLFRLEALNPAGSALSSPARLTVTDGPTAPVMSLEPDGLMLLSGNAALLRAAASGTGPFYYQWWKDALLLVDQTNSTLVLDTTSASDAGGYFVVVSNAVGSVTSQVATITVDQPPPPPILGLAVSEESASVALLGLGGSRWKVQRSGDLSGYWDTLEAVDLDPAGEGWLVDSNSPSAMAFYRAKLDIPPTLPEIEVQPQAWTYYLGSDAVLSVSTSGAGPLHYQWWQNGLALAGQTNQILFLPGVTTNQAGVYQVVVSNFYGAVTSQSILLQVSEELAPENLVQNGSFEIPPVPGSHLYLNSGDAFAGGWTVESTTTFFSLYDNADPYVPGLWHPTTAGSQFVYLADNVAASVLKQDLASPLSASTDYSLSFLQSGFLTARSYPAQVTVTITPSGSAVPVFSQTFALPDGAPWTRQHALFRVPADGFYDLRLISTSGFVANVDDVRVEPTTSIAIVNSSFEDPVIAGGVNWLTGISDWVTSGSVGVSLVNGILPPAPDGVQLGWMSSGGSILQTLPDAVQMDTTYYLSIQVGGRTDGYNPGTSYTVSLLAGTNVLTSIVPVAPAPGTWTNLTASCTITNPVVVGQPLGVRIETTANDFVFDDVQLHATGP